MIRGWFVKDTKNKAGQVINNPGHLIRREKQLNEKYLHEYIARKEDVQPKKLTFEEWLVNYLETMDSGYLRDLKERYAQENK
jgi:hypothetical protein